MVKYRDQDAGRSDHKMSEKRSFGIVWEFNYFGTECILQEIYWH